MTNFSFTPEASVALNQSIIPFIITTFKRQVPTHGHPGKPDLLLNHNQAHDSARRRSVKYGR
jgi:hypothetical protein